MATVLDVIKSAMRQAKVITKNETPSNDEAQDALDSLNELLDSWSNTSNMVFERVTESFTLTSGIASYTIGSGATFDTVRPLKIVEAHIRQGDTDYPLVMIPDRVYQSIANKNTGSIPDMLNYTNEYPSGTINLYPEPGASYTLFITSEKPKSTYTSLSDTVSVPPGYLRAIKYNLAIDICNEYGVSPAQILVTLAAQSKAFVALNALKNNALDAKPASGLADNIYSGYYL